MWQAVLVCRCHGLHHARGAAGAAAGAGDSFGIFPFAFPLVAFSDRFPDRNEKTVETTVYGGGGLLVAVLCPYCHSLNGNCTRINNNKGKRRGRNIPNILFLLGVFRPRRLPYLFVLVYLKSSPE